MDSVFGDDSRIETESQYELVLRTLSKRSRPPKLLRLLMQGLEAYRQSRRMGWSRKQNKYGTRTFATFKMASQIRQFLPLFQQICGSAFGQLAPDRSAFVAELCDGPGLMGFLFFQEVEQGGQHYETVTLSLGRVVPKNRRFRDRVDLILDARIEGNEVTDLTRMRLYVDPFEEHSPSELESLEITSSAHKLLTEISDFYVEHRYRAELVWDHWTQDYIDYFGPRLQAVAKTRFPTRLDDAYEQSKSPQLVQGGVAALEGQVGAA